MKIGLLAMSGLRAHDPRLLQLGMSLPGVVQRGRVLRELPSLGLLYLAARTPPGHELRYFEMDQVGSESPELFDCDLVAISTFSAQIFEAYAVADRLRQAGVRVALGGLHVSAEPAEAQQHADYIFIGEGENTWPVALKAIAGGQSSGIWNARGYPPVDVAELPVPRYDLLPNRPYARFPVQTTRGCPWRCDFCASNVMLGGPYRKRPVEHVIRDIEAIRSRCRRPFIELADDNTFVDHDWGRELCRALVQLKVKWFTETDISVADDPDLLHWMRKARCRQVLVGLESPEQRSLEGIELRSDFKRRRWATNLESVRRIQEAGITVNGCFVLGLDGQTPEIFAQVLEFANAAPLYDVQITVLTPFPGTPLYERLLGEGRILQPGRWDLCTLFDVNFQPRGMTVQQLRDGMYWLASQLYNERALLQRRLAFYGQAAKSHTGFHD